LPGVVEAVAPVCFASNLYIDQGVFVGYKAKAVEASDNTAMKTNAENTYVALFIVDNLLFLSQDKSKSRYILLVVL
jgi:hypothetical protein